MLMADLSNPLCLRLQRCSDFGVELWDMSVKRGVLACLRELVGGFFYIGEHVVLSELVLPWVHWPICGFVIRLHFHQQLNFSIQQLCHFENTIQLLKIVNDSNKVKKLSCTFKVFCSYQVVNNFWALLKSQYLFLFYCILITLLL